MRSRRVITVALLVAAGAACVRESDRQAAISKRRATDSSTRTAAGELATRLSRVELAMFAPLPSYMASGPSRPTEAEVNLGRQLYHETLLSGGHDVSCNSCHALNGYGADGRRVSFGSHGLTGGRNAPTVYNAAGQVAQFWDGRAANVEEQAKGPILNPAEMAMPNPGAVLDHMRASANYRAAFRAAFPNDAQPITYDNVGRAIGAFERGLVTPSRWDEFLAGDSTALSSEEQRGAATFVRVGCAGCHNGAYVGGSSFQKLGRVKPWPTSTDSGRIKVTREASDLFVFKVPSLRNVEKTSPYFHDGSIASLDEAIRLMGRHQLGVQLTDGQVRDIHSWLSSLTGELPASYIAQPRLPRNER